MDRVIVFLLALVLPLCSIGSLVSATKSAILVGESITANKSLVSSNGMFEVGIFHPKGGGNRWYVGIWFAGMGEQSVVWVANRENSIKEVEGANLQLTDGGKLVLTDGLNGTIIWSTQRNNSLSKNHTKGVMKAQVLDSGNFVVMDSEGEILWQSFDYPGDTWLPGMKIGVGQKLSSWRNSIDPALGVFSLELDPSGSSQFVLMWNGSDTYWESGIWNGQFFSNLPEMATKYVYTFALVKKGSDMYFIYSLKPNVKMITRFVLDVSGEVRLYTMNQGQWSVIWSQPRQQCQVYGFCGDFGVCSDQNSPSCKCPQGLVPSNTKLWSAQDWSGGCSSQSPLNCSTDGFLLLNGTSLSEAPYKKASSTSREACMQECRRKCTCSAYVYSSASCKLYQGPLRTLQDSVTITTTESDDIFLRVAASELPKHTTQKPVTTPKPTHDTALIRRLVPITTCIAIASLIMVAIFVWWKLQNTSTEPPSTPATLRVFTYKQLQVATKNFTERLGGGGFGSVFKGYLQDRTQVAVKTLEGSNQGEKQFRMEVSTIGTIQHVNLVRLRGFCSEKALRMLVYEYMPNGSLSTVLFPKPKDGERAKSMLEWSTRYNIALGTARGILYLHERCRDRIIHCDIKPENILLDADFVPKVADFGLAKLVGRDFSQVLTTMRGTRGYLAPEWISGLPVTTKADVYSYGMTLLELVSGRRNLDFSAPTSQLFYPTWAGRKVSEGNMFVEDIVDERVRESLNEKEREEVRRATLVAMWCIQDEAEARPCMVHVVNVLEGNVDIDEVPPVPQSLLLFMEQAGVGVNVSNQVVGDFVPLFSESNSDSV